MRLIKGKKIKLGIVGGGPKSWIGHVHRISSRFDDEYEIVSGVFSRNSNISKTFGKKICANYSKNKTQANSRSFLVFQFCVI